jgi:23S rRNA (adenine2503-C2)-methyltransferase
MSELCAMMRDELKNWLIEREYLPFHADQILDWVYQKNISSWDSMTNLSKDLRNRLSGEIFFPTLNRVSITQSDDGETYKSLWKLTDGSLIESVRVKDGLFVCLRKLDVQPVVPFAPREKRVYCVN